MRFWKKISALQPGDLASQLDILRATCPEIANIVPQNPDLELVVRENECTTTRRRDLLTIEEYMEMVRAERNRRKREPDHAAGQGDVLGLGRLRALNGFVPHHHQRGLLPPWSHR